MSYMTSMTSYFPYNTRIIITGHLHNTQRSRTCEQQKRLDALVLFTSPDAACRRRCKSCVQHKRGDASVLLVGTTNSTTNRSNGVCAYSRQFRRL